MEIVLSIICIVLLVVVIYLLYTTQMKLHEKMAETQANSSSLDRQYNSIITMLNDASRSLGQSDTIIKCLIPDKVIDFNKSSVIPSTVSLMINASYL